MGKIYKYKDSIFESIYKNTRRINVFLRQNQIKRIKAIVLLFVIVFSVISNHGVLAITLENNNFKTGDYNITGEVDKFAYISYDGKQQPNIMYYYNGKTAYCVDRGLKGAEESSTGNNVKVKKKITDEKLQMIILNGYPYKSMEELGLRSVPQAIFATQFAIWCYTDKTLDINKIEPLSEMNNDVVEKIKEIYNSKDGSIEDYYSNIDIVDEEQETILQGGEAYYIKRFYAKNLQNVSNINLKDKRNADGVEIKKLNSNYFQVKIPAKIVEDKYEINLELDMKALDKSILFGETHDSAYQSVAIIPETYYVPTLEHIVFFEAKNSKVTIQKLDSDTNMPIPNVKYSVSDHFGYTNKEYITDENGQIVIDLNNSEDVAICVQEKEVNSKYVMDITPYNYVITPNSTKNITLYNDRAKGYIEIVKKTKEYNEETNLPENYPLDNVEFQILDENMEIVDTLITDKSGYAKSKALDLGRYYIKEIKTKDYYEILKDVVALNIDKNEDIVNVQILNANVYIQKKMPVTGT